MFVRRYSAVASLRTRHDLSSPYMSSWPSCPTWSPPQIVTSKHAVTLTLLYIIQHSVMEIQLLPPCIMNQRIKELLLQMWLYLILHARRRSYTHTQCCLTERLVWSDSNVILIATGDDSLSLLCWYPQAWQSFGHTCHRCTSANTRTISPPCLFWYSFVSPPSTYLFIYIGWHPAEFTSIQIFKYFSSENPAEFTARVLCSQHLLLLSLGSRALLLFLQPTLFYSLLFILRTESNAFTAVLE